MQLLFANYYLHNLENLNNRHLEVCLNQVATTILMFPCESVRKDKIIMESRLILIEKKIELLEKRSNFEMTQANCKVEYTIL